jgi:hypothetical protein
MKTDSSKLIKFIRLFESFPDAVFEYLNLLEYGQERIVRNLVSEARSIGIPIAKAESGGYKYAKTYAEYKHTYYSERQHVFSVLFAQGKVLQHFKDQGSLPLSEEMEYRDLMKFLNEAKAENT